LSSLRKLL